MKFPPLLAALHALDYETDEDDGLYFEALTAFMPKKEVKRWFRAWTDNPEADGRCLKVFAEDGAGGLTAFWQVQADAPLLTQPVVFLGSEGEIGVAARDFEDYLWLLAQGHAAAEAVAGMDADRPRVKAFARFAKQHAPARKRSVARIVADAEAAFPMFRAWVIAQCDTGSADDSASRGARLALRYWVVDDALADDVPQRLGCVRHDDWPAAAGLLLRLGAPLLASLLPVEGETRLSPKVVSETLASLLPWLVQEQPAAERVLLERMIAMLAYAQARQLSLLVKA